VDPDAGRPDDDDPEFFPLGQDLKIVGTAHLIPGDPAEQVVIREEEGAMDCTYVQALVIGTHAGTDRLEPLVRVSQVCRLQVSLPPEKDRLMLTGPHYEKGDGLIAPSKLKVTAVLRHTVKGWELKPGYFSLESPPGKWGDD
jgi:hypothetical protein